MKATWTLLLSVTLTVISILYSGPVVAEAQSTSVPAVTIVRRNPRFDVLIAPNTTVEKLADGFSWVEGPVWHRKEHFLLFSDVIANTIFKWHEGTQRDRLFTGWEEGVREQYRSRERHLDGVRREEGRCVVYQWPRIF